MERSTRISLPGIEEFNPTTARPIIPSDDHICRYTRPRNGFIQIRHSMIVTIEMKAADTISIEAGCYLTGMGKAEINKMLEEDPEVMPTLDYNKLVVGLEVWVPEYEQHQHLDHSDGNRLESIQSPSNSVRREDNAEVSVVEEYQPVLNDATSSAVDNSTSSELFHDAYSDIVEPSFSCKPTPMGINPDQRVIPSSPPPAYAFDNISRPTDPDLEPVLNLSALGPSESLLDLENLVRTIPKRPPQNIALLEDAIFEAMNESFY